MASTGNTSFLNFYNGSPGVIIKNKAGNYYSFPSTFYNNGSGGTVKSEDSWCYASGRIWDNFRTDNAEPWSLCRQIDMTTLASTNNLLPRDIDGSNAESQNDVADLNTNAKDNIAGYKLQSSGSYKNNSRNYILGDRGSSRQSVVFSVYTKKDELAFFNDFIGLGGDTKTKFLTMAANDAEDHNRRFSKQYIVNACNDNATPDAGKAKCRQGTVNLCNSNPHTYIWRGDVDKTINNNGSVCKDVISFLDDTLFNNCSGKSVIDNIFCTDIRQNSGSQNLKNRLNVALGEHCRGTGNDINDPLCSEVKTACSAPKAALDVTTVPNYQCKTLVNSLNDINKIAMLESTMNIFAATTAPKLEGTEKGILSTDFNGTTKAVQSALCSKAANASEATCKLFLSENYKTLLNNTTSGVTDAKPVLIMYFNDSSPSNTSKLFDTPLNMVGHNSLNISSPTWAPTGVTPRWYAKLYTYITPSTINDYLFVLKADDDAKLFINNTLIIDAWGKTCCQDYDAQSYISLNPANGPYLLTVEYRDTGGAANMYVKYKLRTDNHLSPMPVYEFIVLPTISSSSTIRAPVTGTVAGTNVLHSSMTAGRLYMSKFHPYEIIENARRQQSLSYCQANNASGVPRFASDSNCLTNINNMYALSQNTKDDPYRTMINDYCRTNNRFATDTNFCDKDTYSSYILNAINSNSDLNTALGTYCRNIANNTSTSFCTVKDNQNTTNFKSTASPKPKTMNDTYAATIRNNRLAAMREAIDTSLGLTGTGKGTVTQEVITYITTDYPAIQSAFGIANYANDRLIPHMLYAYCESLTGSTIASIGSVKTLTTTSNLCNAIYNTYKTDLNIIASLQRIEDNIYGIQNKAFMGLSSDANLNIKYIAERDSPEKFARYLPYAVNHCAEGTNIVSKQCQDYYEGIEGNINAGFAKQYNNASVSGFVNKEEFCNNNEYDNGCDNECNNSNSLIFFLLFLFVIILVISLGSVSNCRKPNYYSPYNDYSYY